MRILQWTERFWPSVGGVEVIAADLVVSLQERGHHSLVVVSEQAGFPEEADFRGTPVRRLAICDALRQGDLERLVTTERQLRVMARAFRPDLVHVLMPGASLLPVLRLAMSERWPLVLTLQGEIPGPWRHKGNTLFTQAVQAAAWLTSCSSAVLDQALEIVPGIRPRSSIVYYGLDVAAHPPPAPIPAGPPRLLCFGRLAPEKGFDVAIDACARLAARYPVEMTIGGSGHERDTLERQVAARGLDGRVRFLGAVPFAATAAMYDAATIVLMPSRTEGFPRVALETAARGRPIVASRVGGLPEAVVDGVTGLLVEPGDAEALAAGVATLLDDADRAARMGAAARRRVVEQLNWQRTVDAFENVYARALSGAAACVDTRTTQQVSSARNA